MWYKNIAGRFFELVTKHACDRQTDGRTDRRTDRQNYDSQDRATITASCSKNRTMHAQITDKMLNICHIRHSVVKLELLFRLEK